MFRSPRDQLSRVDLLARRGLPGGAGWREESLSVAFAGQEHEAGEVAAKRFKVVGLAADEAGQGLAEPNAVSREPVVQELEELAEFASPESRLTFTGAARRRGGWRR